MHVDYQALHGSIRFSLSRFNTDAEIDAIVDAVPRIIRELRAISPFGK
jgi:cysteine desulfurase